MVEGKGIRYWDKGEGEGRGRREREMVEGEGRGRCLEYFFPFFIEVLQYTVLYIPYMLKILILSTRTL